VVTDGFYEWRRITAKEKQPYAVAMADDGMMVMAGLWSKWKDPKSDNEVLSCTILTCPPNDVMAELHDRMPVILAENDWPKWLGEEPASEEELLAILKPCLDDALKIWPVGQAVGNVKNTGPQLLMPV
jgi:putative SOS response-associated peptidase YedK